MRDSTSEECWGYALLGMWAERTYIWVLSFQKVGEMLCLWINGTLDEGLPTKVYTPLNGPTKSP